MRKNKTIIKSILVILLAISPLTPMLSNVHGDNIAQHTFQGARPINELFPDENLANVIAQKLGVADSSVAVTISQLQMQTTLEASGKNIRDLTGMEYLSGLMFIQLSNNQISDLTPLENLNYITNLDLMSNQITDVSPLEGKIIMSLTLDYNHISDISPLNAISITAFEQTISLPDAIVDNSTNFVLRDRNGNLPNYTIVGGDSVGVYDGTQLTWKEAGDHTMTWFAVEFSGKVTQTAIPADRIKDYFPDDNLAQIIATVLNGNNDTNALVSKEQLAAITDLQVINPQVENLQGMELLTGLRTLEIVGTEVSNINPIGGSIHLTHLDLRDNNIENINALSNLTNLTNLSLAYNEIIDVTPLSNLSNLHILNLDNNNIHDISSLPEVALTPNFTALGQTVTLDSGYLNVPQRVVLLNQYGENPSVRNKDGVGTLINGILTWTERSPNGLNSLEWVGPGSFQGVLEQKVEEAITIYELFEDENLAKAIAITLNNNEENAVVTEDELAAIETLNINGRGISSLLGMKYLTGLKYLSASMNRINDLSDLKELEKLEVLHLDMNHIEDITPLKGLGKLTTLSLNNNAITDISILSVGFADLDKFTALNQNVSLPGAFTGMPTPLTLRDRTNVVPTITYIIGDGNYNSTSNMLTWGTAGENFLRWNSTSFSGILSQRVNQGVESITISDLFLCDNLALIIATRLGKDSIDAVVTWDELASITNIAAATRQIRSLEGIQYLTNLRDLSLFNNEITDLTPLRNLTNLRTLYIGFNQITDISPLANLENLDILDFNHNKVSDVSIAANLPSLTRLRFSGNHVTDISSLGEIVDNLRDFNALNQVIDLPKVVVGQATPITIRNHRGEVPNFTSIAGQGLTYDRDKHELIWTTTGDNSFRWSGPISFTGQVRQTVVASDDEL